MEEMQRVTEGGSFLPLGVWEKKGFDPIAIERGGRMEMHPILGPTYQCPIKETSQSSTQRLVRQTLLTMKEGSKSRRSALPSAGGSGGDAEASAASTHAQKVTESSSSSSSSSSDSSGRDRKSKKAKKAKKAMKAKKKALKAAQKEKARQKEEQKKADAHQKALYYACRRVHSDSTKTLTKVGHSILQLDDIMKQTCFADLPRTAQTRVIDLAKALKGVEVESKDRLSSKQPEALTFTLDFVSDLVKNAAAIIPVAQNLLRNLQKI